jgi:catechol 2,3-dioxygenase-like lactoylglutathione lyase family enzyme
LPGAPALSAGRARQAAHALATVGVTPAEHPVRCQSRHSWTKVSLRKSRRRARMQPSVLQSSRAGTSAISDGVRRGEEARRPIAGHFAFALFSLGILGTGLLSVPVLAGSAAYALGEAQRWPAGLSRKQRAAKAFLWAIVAAILLGTLANAASINAVTALVWAAVINAIVAVPAMCVDVDGRRRAAYHGAICHLVSLAIPRLPGHHCDGSRWRHLLLSAADAGQYKHRRSKSYRRFSMPGIHHVSVGVDDVARAKAFYDPLLKIVGLEKRRADERSVHCGSDVGIDFSLERPVDRHPAAPGKGGHVAFAAPNRNTVDVLHREALRFGEGDAGIEALINSPVPPSQRSGA